MAETGLGSDTVRSPFLSCQAVGLPGARNFIFSLKCMLSSPLLSSGSWGWQGEESAKKDLDKQRDGGAQPAGFEELGVL